MKTNPNDLTFSTTVYKDMENTKSLFPQSGLTKREYFAAMALASGRTSEESIKEADNLIKLLNNEK